MFDHFQAKHLSEPTFLFGRTGQQVFVLLLPRHPTVLHPAEEGSPGPGGQVWRPDGGVHLNLDPSCTQKDTMLTSTRPTMRYILSCFSDLDVSTDLLAASMRRWRGYSEDASCSFTLWMSLGWMKSNKLCPVSSNWESKMTINFSFI